ncbi:MAG: CRISPR-associated protein, partial [Candidatus Electrothrix sp. MAN1_4]|nr:CRISPR-associated protein [Candidatus Electrothrix sp. MAN1_4]
IVKGLNGETARTYGLPFIGDNSFLPDRLEAVEEPEPARWFAPVAAEDEDGVLEDITRLTISIDRISMTNTRSALFAPQQVPSAEIPEQAWVRIAY